MSTIVFVHAHPDDEATATAGSMIRAAREGHRVVVVYCTDGDPGEHGDGDVPDDLAPGETVAMRRRGEAEASAAITGTARVAWLGYADSGMTGWTQNGTDGVFSRAPIEEAARRLADILDEEGADVVVGYDWHGGYGHPDHVMLHHTTRAAAELAVKRPRYLEVTMNRDLMRQLFVLAAEMGLAGENDTDGFDPDAAGDDGNPIGTPEAELHWAVDLGDDVTAKREALACHASQSDVRQLLALPVEAFPFAFGTEHYIEPGRPPGMVRGWWLDAG
ncbi:PIG-L deacetylase family protein [Gordonia polyisoprenivorans]|uniref:PIG-L deacetylase family protein n=1 Tax=Gordonia polyisoprenivorans TaxID=84595 RepID=UPI00230129D5|nr:PIG-L family deacetylase [Gordonia polyisoprenivorans]WCB37783.1 PIG-L family deacetylase [Gordonia polyisoprenivorans]